MSIDITKLKKNTKLLIEPADTVFEIIVTGPKSCTATVHGGIKFIRPTKATISGAINPNALEKSSRGTLIKKNYIEKNQCLEFIYKKNNSKDKAELFVLSANIEESSK